MGDLIERQDAIKAVCSVCGDTECKGYENKDKNKLFCPDPCAISKIPSVETQTNRNITVVTSKDKELIADISGDEVICKQGYEVIIN